MPTATAAKKNGHANGAAIAALRAEVNELHHLARAKLTDDGYRGVELERLASRFVELALLARNQRLPWMAR